MGQDGEYMVICGSKGTILNSMECVQSIDMLIFQSKNKRLHLKNKLKQGLWFCESRICYVVILDLVLNMSILLFMLGILNVKNKIVDILCLIVCKQIIFLIETLLMKFFREISSNLSLIS